MPKPLRRNREFVALWVGQTTSALGTSISTLAYPLVVLAATGSPALAGLVGSVLAITTFVVRIPAGLVVDRVDRRRLMLLCDAGRIVAVGSVAAALVAGHLVLPHLLAVAVVEGALGSLFGPAELTAVRRVVAPEQVRDATAVHQVRQQFAAVVGPLVGGVLFGVGRAWPFVADALSYLVSFLTVRTVRPLPAEPRRSGRPLHTELTEGLRWLWHRRFLRAVALWLSAAGALFTSMGLVTVVLAQERGATPAEVGLMFTVVGLGGLAGAVTAPWLLRRHRPGVVLVGYAWVATVATYALLFTTSAVALGVAGAIAFYLVPAVNAIVMAEVVTRAPEALQGRAISATVQLTTLLHPVGPGLAGVALQLLGTTTTVTAYGTMFAILAVLISALPAFRHGDP